MLKLVTYFFTLILYTSLSHGESVNLGQSIATWNPSVPSKNLLLVSIGGTNSQPSDFTAFTEEALKLGFAALAVDYDNHVISTTCQDSSNNLCFDQFREEVVQGISVSELLEIPPEKAIEVQIRTLLQKIAKRDPSRWSLFLKNNRVQWHRTVVVGHSQGSGHAAYLAKIHRLRGVIVIAGPQDRFTDGRDVEWLKRRSKTPTNRYFFLLHEKDFFGSQHQLANAHKLLENKFTENIILSKVAVQDPHRALIQPQFATQWKELLERVLAP